MPESQTAADQKFANLGRPRRLWVVGAVHADVARLDAVHGLVADRFQPGDRLVYLGNMIGRGPAVLETVESLLSFRRWLIACPGVIASDVVYLRGAQEEMWQKLLQLHFAPDPLNVLDWMMRQGVSATLAAYGGSTEQGRAAARGGAVMLGRWTQGLRQAVQARPGHENVFSALRRAAYVGIPASEAGAKAATPPDGPASAGAGTPTGGGGVLLVSAGLDPRRRLGNQGDAFWWGSAGFAAISASYDGFARVVRGFDPSGGGAAAGDVAVTFDGGCGRGGHLLCGCLSPTGEILDLFQI